MKRLLSSRITIYGVSALAAILFSARFFGQQPRYAQLKLEETQGDQRTLAERMIKETRVGLAGPWNIMLRSPGMGEAVLNLYNYYRHNTSLPPRQMEFGVLITSREWDAQFEWFTHYPLAVKAGVSPAVLAELRAGRRPKDMNAEQSAEYDFAIELLRKHTVSDTTFRRANEQMGEKGVVELTGLIGTYVTFGALINVSQVPVSPGKDAPEYLPVTTR
jgi:4-carboxymuconolactone decarboxylase